MSRAEGFAAVPNWMIRDETFDGYEIAVYTALASHTGPGGIRPSQATLAREARCSERKVRDTLQKLVDRGVIEVVRRRRRDAGKQTNVSNGYRLLPHGSVDESEFAFDEVPARGADSSGKLPAPGDEATGTRVRTLLSIEEEPVEEETSGVASVDLPMRYQPEIYRLCDLLAAHVRENGHKVGTVGAKWWSACDRLMRLDGYTAQQVEWMIRWATAHEFWSANIRSMSTLREKFSTLKAQAMRDAQRTQRTSAEARARSVLDMGRELALEGAAS